MKTPRTRLIAAVITAALVFAAGAYVGFKKAALRDAASPRASSPAP